MGCLNSKVSPLFISTDQSPLITTASLFGNHAKIIPLRPDMNDSFASFHDVISERQGREYLMKFLMSEHAEENLAFFIVSPFYSDSKAILTT